jgi:excinuclease ABC subunit C
MTRTPNPTSARSSKAAAPADGGVIYEETDTDEDEQEAIDAPLPADVANVAGMEWNESPGVTPGLKGAEVIQAFVRHLPNQPGVYRMMNEAGDVLYVGKARSLKKRVTNYAQGRGHSNRITRMIAQTTNMEFVTTRTEAEALLLEANLIKRLKPRFNVLMRDDKSFPYILVTGDHEAPRSSSTAARASARATYFGPFASAGAVGRTINALQRAFLLRTCTDSVYESRTRPCLLYQIKRCAGPCTGEIDAEGYAGWWVKPRISFRAAARREGATGNPDAGRPRKSSISSGRGLSRPPVGAQRTCRATRASTRRPSKKPMCLPSIRMAAMTCIQVFFFRTGQNWGNRAYFPKADPSLAPRRDPWRFIGAVLRRQADAAADPDLDDFEDRTLLEEALSVRMDRKTSISVPQRGEKRELVEHVLNNAREAHRPQPGRDGLARRGFCKGLPRPSTWPIRRAGSRSTTTPTSWAPMPWAA